MLRLSIVHKNFIIMYYGINGILDTLIKCVIIYKCLVQGRYCLFIKGKKEKLSEGHE